MYVLYVTPLRSGMPQDRLTYWSKTEVSPGTFVHVQIGKTQVEALVVACEDLREKKQEIRSSSFGIKHIESEMKLARLKASTAVGIYELSLLSGQTVGDYVVGFLGLDAYTLSKTYRETQTKEPELYIESDIVLRVSRYIQVHKEGSSHTVIVVPSAGHADALERILTSQGCTPLVFHSNKTKTESERSQQRLASSAAHICICTPQSSGALLSDTALLIIEYTYSHLYQIDFVAQMNSMQSLYCFAKLMNIPVLLADSHRLPGVRDIPANITGAATMPNLYIADMKDGIQVKNTYFSMAILDFIRTKASGEKLVLFINRKGIAPQLVCNDCSTTVLCEYCSHPLALMADDLGSRYTLCTSCKKEQQLLEGRELICSTCGSMKITQIGLATDSVLSELKKLGFSATVFDSNHIRTYPQAKKAIRNFYTSDTDILIATEMVMPYLLPGYQRICVLSIDPLLHHKNHRADFELRDTVYRLAYLSRDRELLLQSRYAPHVRRILLTEEKEYILLSEQELKLCGYPPYTYEISLTTKKDIQQFSKLLEDKSIKSFVSKRGTQHNIKLRVKDRDAALALVREYIEVRKELLLTIS